MKTRFLYDQGVHR